MKKISIFLFLASFFSFCGKSFAQFSVAWSAGYQHTTSLNFSNESRKTAVDATGNIFVLADVTSDIDPNGIGTTNTFSYTVLLKYDSSGMALDEEDIDVNSLNFTGFNCSGSFGLELDAAGNVYVGYTTYDMANDFDANISKYDNNLNFIWNYRFKPSSNDMGVGMKISSAGNAYAIVKSVSGLNTTYHILSANSGGATTTPFYSFDMNQDYLNSLVVDANQNIYVTGYRIISSYKNVLTASLNSAGTLIWKVTYNGGSANRDDIGTSLCFNNSYVYVVGTSDMGVPNGNDVAVLKLNSASGKNEWVSLRHYNNNDKGFFVYVPSAAYVYVGSVSMNAVLLDRLRIATGIPSGRAVYQPEPVRPYSAINGVTLSDMKVSSNLNFYLTGTINAEDTSSQNFSAAYLARFILLPASRAAFKLDYEAPAEGEFDASLTASAIALDESKEDVYWLRDRILDYSNHNREIVDLTDIDVPSQIKIAGTSDLTEQNSLSVYPNPAHDFISFFSNDAIVKFEFFDITGQKIKTILVESQNIELNISELMPGIYIYKAYKTSGDMICRKIVKN